MRLPAPASSASVRVAAEIRELSRRWLGTLAHEGRKTGNGR